MSKMEKYLDQIKEINKKYEEDIQAVLNQIQTEVVQPFCEEQEVSFDASFGSWDFHNYGELQEIPEEIKNLLDYEILPDFCTELGANLLNVNC